MAVSYTRRYRPGGGLFFVSMFMARRRTEWEASASWKLEDLGTAKWCTGSRRESTRCLSSKGRSSPTASWPSRPPMTTTTSLPCTLHSMERLHLFHCSAEEVRVQNEYKPKHQTTERIHRAVQLRTADRTTCTANSQRPPPCRRRRRRRTPTSPAHPCSEETPSPKTLLSRHSHQLRRAGSEGAAKRIDRRRPPSFNTTRARVSATHLHRRQPAPPPNFTNTPQQATTARCIRP